MARRTRRRALVLAGLGVWGWLVGGGFRPLTALVSQLPGLGLTSTTRALPLVSLALALVVGLGIEAWSRGPRLQRFGVAVVALGLLLAVSGGGIRFGLLATGVLGAALGAGRSPRLAALALTAVMTADLVGVSRQFLPRGEPHFFYPANEAIEDIRRELSGGEPWRIVGENYAAYPAVLAPHELADIRPHDPLASEALVQVLGAAFGFAPSTAEWYSPLGNVEHPLPDFLGVRVVVSDYAQPPKQRLERIDEPWRHGIHALWRNPGALPRVFVPTAIDHVPPENMSAWIAAMTDPRRVAVSSSLSCIAAGREVGLRLETNPGRVDILVDGEPCLLATSIPFVPGWSARGEDGRKVDLVPVNHAFVGLVEPGSGSIELVYRAPGLQLGFGVAAAALGLLALLVSRLPSKSLGLLSAPDEAARRSATEGRFHGPSM